MSSDQIAFCAFLVSFVAAFFSWRATSLSANAMIRSRINEYQAGMDLMDAAQTRCLLAVDRQDESWKQSDWVELINATQKVYSLVSEFNWQEKKLNMAWRDYRQFVQNEDNIAVGFQRWEDELQATRRDKLRRDVLKELEFLFSKTKYKSKFLGNNLLSSFDKIKRQTTAPASDR